MYGGYCKILLEFTVDESCGKCTPCRIGTRRMLELLDKITKGQATMEDLDKLEELCYHLKDNSLCALGQTAPNPVLSTLRYFRDEYIAHIVDKNVLRESVKSCCNTKLMRINVKAVHFVQEHVRTMRLLAR